MPADYSLLLQKGHDVTTCLNGINVQRGCFVIDAVGDFDFSEDPGAAFGGGFCMFPYLGPEFITALMEITSTRQRKAGRPRSSSKSDDNSNPQMPASGGPTHTGVSCETSFACNNGTAEAAQGLNEKASDTREYDEA